MFRTVLLSGAGMPIELKDGKTFAYWDCKSGITQDGSGYVSSWLDRLNGVALVQATANAQPLKADGIVFDGGTDFMATGAKTLAQPVTIYLAMRIKTWSSGDYLMDGLFTGTFVYTQYSSSPNLAMYSGTILSNNTCVLNTNEIHTLVFNGASSALQINNRENAVGNVGAGSAGGLTLGAKPTGANCADIVVFDFIVRTQVDSTSVQAKIKNYLARKNNISL